MAEPTPAAAPVPWPALLLCALVMLIDGYDLSAMPLAVPRIAAEWGLAPAGFGIALSAVLVGLGLGAVLVAPLGDRLGRRPLVIVSVVAIALATLGTATGTSIWAFVAWRLLTGIALGACLPNVTALVAELAPPQRRMGLLTIVSCGISIGALGAGLAAPMLAASGGWRMIFLAAGAVTLAIAALLWLVLPESPKLRQAQETPARLPLLAPLGRQHWRATLVFAGLYTINALSLYMLVSWLPTLLPRAGFTVDEAARMSAWVQGGGLAIGLALSGLLDRGWTVAALAGGYALVALALLGFSVLPASGAVWGVLLLVAGGGISGAHLAILAVGTSFYPPAMLSSAIGLVVAVARLGAVTGPMVGSWLVGMAFGPAAFMLALLVPVLACAVLVLLIPAVSPARTAA